MVTLFLRLSLNGVWDPVIRKLDERGSWITLDEPGVLSRVHSFPGIWSFGSRNHGSRSQQASPHRTEETEHEEGVYLAGGLTSWHLGVTCRTQDFWLDSSKPGSRACPRHASLLVWPLREIPVLLRVKSSPWHKAHVKQYLGLQGVKDPGENLDCGRAEGGRRKESWLAPTRLNLVSASRDTKTSRWDGLGTFSVPKIITGRAAQFPKRTYYISHIFD